MKTKTLIMLCLLLGIGLTQLSAQKGKNPHDTKSVKYEVVWDGYWMPIICNGELVDYLYGTVTVYPVYHFVDGIPIWCNYHTVGEAVSTSYGDIFVGTGEVFTVKENDFTQYTVNGEWPRYVTFHFNLMGDKGNHYQGTTYADTWSLTPDAMTFVKINCH